MKFYNELFAQKSKELKLIHTFKEYFEWIKNQNDDHVFFEYNDSHTYSYDYFFGKSNAVSLYLKEKLINLKKDSWVGMKLPNHPLYLIILFSLLKNGFNVLFIDNNISAKNGNKVIEKSGISAIVTDKIIDGIDIMYINFAEILNLGEKDETDEYSFFADKIALCSSGTEGNIKISYYDGENFLEAIRKMIIGFENFFPKSVLPVEICKIVVSPPFFHIFGLIMLFIFFSVGITIVINENNSLTCFLKNVNRKGVQIVAHIPMILDNLFKFINGKYNELTCETLRNMVGENLKVFIGAGISTTEKNKELLKQSGIYYIDCYGTTETCAIAINNRICESIHSKVEVFDNGKFSTQGYGEMIVYGKGIRSGILEDGSEILKHNSLRENCIKTGDLVEIKNNTVFIKGRSNDIIIGSNGENIIPSEIEEHFDFLKDYHCQYTVFGIEEKPVMVIFMEKEQCTATYKERLIEKISQKNREMKLRERITSIYFTLMPIPLTGSSKVKKAFVKEQIINQKQEFEKIVLIER